MILIYFITKSKVILLFLHIMKRLIEIYLQEWINNPRHKPLILRGARQVGKTWIVDKLGREHFSYYLKVNPEKDKDVEQVFKSRNPKLIIQELTVLYNTPIVPEKTLLFIDEVQLLPDAITALRYFYEDYPGLHVITAGSLLDHTLNELAYSMPVGRVEFAYMYPMNFQEFLMANGEEGLFHYMVNYQPGSPFSEAIHEKLKEYLRFYFFIGGMPEAVSVFIQEGNLIEVEKVHKGILTSLQYDFAKYGTRTQQDHLNACFQYAGRNPGKKIKYTNINRSVQAKQLKEALMKLEMSRIVHLVRKTRSANIPINQYVDNDRFKPLFLDIGLVSSLSAIKLTDLQNLLTDFEGVLAEQFIGQELLASFPCYEDSKLYYWFREEKNAGAEVDYLFQIKNHIVPVEVKAGKSGTLKSLQVYLFEKGKTNGVRLNLDKPSFGTNLTAHIQVGGVSRKLVYNLYSLPLYLAFRMRELLSPFLMETNRDINSYTDAGD